MSNLILKFDSRLPNVNNATVRLYKNDFSSTEQLTSTDWVLENAWLPTASPPSTLYMDLSLNNLQRLTTPSRGAAFSTLDEHFMGEVYFGNTIKMSQIIGDISGGSGNFLDISANTTITGPVRIDGELGVTGDIITDGSLNVTGTGVFGGN